jgi:hypothetical protein
LRHQLAVFLKLAVFLQKMHKQNLSSATLPFSQGLEYRHCALSNAIKIKYEFATLPFAQK